MASLADFKKQTRELLGLSSADMVEALVSQGMRRNVAEQIVRSKGTSAVMLPSVPEAKT